MRPLDPSLFSLQQPTSQTLPLVVAVPHAGRDYGERFSSGTVIGLPQLRVTEDAFADELASQAPALGIPLLCALFPRIWLDVNRDAGEIDPLLTPDASAEASFLASNNVRAGLGVVPRLLTGGRTIHAAQLPMAEIKARLSMAWRPYHDCLAELTETTRQHFGTCLLIDCHSMPSGREIDPVDIALGDGFGATADPSIVDEAERFFLELGLNVSRNQPYAGGYTTRHYGKPETGIHALQIEIRRGLYMDERSFERQPGLAELTTHLGDLFARMGRIVHSLA